METTKRRFRNVLRYELEPSFTESNFGPSKTVPEEALTVRELFERHRAGMDAGSYKQESFDPSADLDTQDLEKVKGLDLVEQMEVLNDLRENAADLKRQIDEEEAKRKKMLAEQQEEEEAIKKEFRERRKRKKEPEGESVTPGERSTDGED